MRCPLTGQDWAPSSAGKPVKKRVPAKPKFKAASKAGEIFGAGREDWLAWLDLETFRSSLSIGPTSSAEELRVGASQSVSKDPHSALPDLPLNS